MTREQLAQLRNPAADLVRLAPSQSHHEFDCGPVAGRRASEIAGRRRIEAQTLRTPFLYPGSSRRSGQRWDSEQEVQTRAAVAVARGELGEIELDRLDQRRAAARIENGLTVAPVEVTDTMAPGVVRLPHGWGHDLPGASSR